MLLRSSQFQTIVLLLKRVLNAIIPSVTWTWITMKHDKWISSQELILKQKFKYLSTHVSFSTFYCKWYLRLLAKERLRLPGSSNLTPLFLEILNLPKSEIENIDFSIDICVMYIHMKQVQEIHMHEQIVKLINAKFEWRYRA